MHPRATVKAALRSARDGASIAEIASVLDVPRRTVSGWLAGLPPRAYDRDACPECGAAHDLTALSGKYAYLLGLYLGDGCISHHHRRVFKLRIFLDERYPGIVADAIQASRVVRGGHAAAVAKPPNCVEVYSFWRGWPCLFPQHGPGKKHERTIALEPWQAALVARWPEQLLRGLIQSDGCRFINTGRNWTCPRYSFTNYSADIHAIFRDTCAQIGLHWTASGEHTTYVSRRADVAHLDTFIGPKR